MSNAVPFERRVEIFNVFICRQQKKMWIHFYKWRRDHPLLVVNSSKFMPQITHVHRGENSVMLAATAQELFFSRSTLSGSSSSKLVRFSLVYLWIRPFQFALVICSFLFFSLFILFKMKEILVSILFFIYKFSSYVEWRKTNEENFRKKKLSKIFFIHFYLFFFSFFPPFLSYLFFLCFIFLRLHLFFHILFCLFFFRLKKFCSFPFGILFDVSSFFQFLSWFSSFFSFSSLHLKIKWNLL